MLTKFDHRKATLTATLLIFLKLASSRLNLIRQICYCCVAFCYSGCPSRPLLVVAQADIDGQILELGGDAGNISLAKVIGEEDAGLDDAGGMQELVGGHRVRLVAGQEGDVDSLLSIALGGGGEVSHLRNVLSVAGHIDAEAVEGDDKTIIATFRMELQVPLGDVVGGHGLQAEVVGQREAVAVLHDLGCGHGNILQQVGATPVGDETSGVAREQTDGRRVEVVTVLVRHEDVVGLRHGCVVDGAVAECADGVDVDMTVADVEADAGMQECMEANNLPTGRGELVHLILRRRDGLAVSLPCNNAAHKVYDLIALLGEHACRTCRPLATTTIDGHRAILIETSGGIGEERRLVDVDVQRLVEVAFGVFLSRAHVEQLHSGIGHELLEAVHFLILKCLLAAGSAGSHSKQRQHESNDFLHRFISLSLSNLPTFQPSNFPTFQPFNFPTFQPFNFPTFQLSNLSTFQLSSANRRRMSP